MKKFTNFILTCFPRRQMWRGGHSGECLSRIITLSAQIVATQEWIGCFSKPIGDVFCLNKAWDTLNPVCAATKTFFVQQRGSHVPTLFWCPCDPFCSVVEYFFAQRRGWLEPILFLHAKWIVLAIVRSVSTTMNS